MTRNLAKSFARHSSLITHHRRKVTSHPSLLTASSGQALIETALVVPFLLALALNVINFSYLFVVAINLAAAPRSGALYAILGDATPASANAGFPGLPPAGSSTTTTSVSYLTYQDLTGAVYAPTTNGSVQVCSTTACAAGSGCVSGSGTSQASECQTFGGTPSYPFPAPTPDPENNGTNPMFYVSRVDIAYQFQPLVPGFIFNLFTVVIPACGSSGTCVFDRTAVMREMN